MNSSTSSSREGSVSMGGKVGETLVETPAESLSRSSRTSGAGKRSLVRRIAWGLIGVIVLLVCSEVFVFRNVDFYGKQPIWLGQFADLDHSWRTAEPEKVETAIFGDSMGMDGMRPAMLAEAAGVDPNTIFNFSITGGKAYEIYHTYLKYRDQMPNLKRAFIVVNEHQINNTDVDQQIMFRYYAGLGDRLKVMNKDNYGELVLGWALKAWDTRSEWTQMVNKYLNPEKNGKLRDTIPAYPHGQAPNTMPGALTAEEGKATADRWFEGYNLEGVLTDSFESLVRDLRERGVEVMILRLPRSELFESAANRYHGAEKAAFGETIASIAERYGAKFDVIGNSALRTDRDFRDPNHLNENGARWLAGYVVEKWLKGNR